MSDLLNALASFPSAPVVAARPAGSVGPAGPSGSTTTSATPTTSAASAASGSSGKGASPDNPSAAGVGAAEGADRADAADGATTAGGATAAAGQSKADADATQGKLSFNEVMHQMRQLASPPTAQVAAVSGADAQRQGLADVEVDPEADATPAWLSALVEGAVSSQRAGTAMLAPTNPANPAPGSGRMRGGLIEIAISPSLAVITVGGPQEPSDEALARFARSQALSDEVPQNLSPLAAMMAPLMGFMGSGVAGLPADRAAPAALRTAQGALVSAAQGAIGVGDSTGLVGGNTGADAAVQLLQTTPSAAQPLPVTTSAAQPLPVTPSAAQPLPVTPSAAQAAPGASAAVSTPPALPTLTQASAQQVPDAVALQSGNSMERLGWSNLGPRISGAAQGAQTVAVQGAVQGAAQWTDKLAAKGDGPLAARSAEALVAVPAWAVLSRQATWGDSAPSVRHETEEDDAPVQPLAEPRTQGLREQAASAPQQPAAAAQSQRNSATPQAQTLHLPEAATMKAEELSRMLGEAVGERMAEQIGSGRWEMKLRLMPQSLGEIDIHMKMHGRDVAAAFQVSSHQTQALLSDGMGRLKEAFSASGMDIASTVVSGGLDDRNRGNPTPWQQQNMAGGSTGSPAASKGATAAAPEVSVAPERMGVNRASDGSLDVLV